MTTAPALLSAAALDEIRARCDAATPGPWRSEKSYRGGDYIEAECKDAFGNATLIQCPGSGGAMSYTNTVAQLNWSETEEWDANRDFIAHARQDVPALLTHAAAQAERIADLSQQCDAANAVVMKCEARISRLRAAIAEYRYHWGDGPFAKLQPGDMG